MPSFRWRLCRPQNDRELLYVQRLERRTYFLREQRRLFRGREVVASGKPILSGVAFYQS
jgi:hypothetical protein